MATIFPADPEINDEYQGYRYNGISWDIIGIDLTADYQPRVSNVSDTELGYLDGVTSSIQTQLGTKAPLASPTFTGTVTIPTGASISGYATETYVGTAVSNLVDAAPSTLNTLNELAAALGDDANYASTITTALGNKAPTASPTFTGTVTIPNSLGSGLLVKNEIGVDLGILGFYNNSTSLGYIKKSDSTYNGLTVGSGEGTVNNRSQITFYPSQLSNRLDLTSSSNGEYQAVIVENSGGVSFYNTLLPGTNKWQMFIKSDGEVEILRSAKIKNPALNIDSIGDVPQYTTAAFSLSYANGSGGSFDAGGQYQVNPTYPDDYAPSNQLVEIEPWSYDSDLYLSGVQFYVTGSGYSNVDWDGSFTLVGSDAQQIANVESWLATNPDYLQFKYVSGTAQEEIVVTINKEELLTLNNVTSNIQTQLNSKANLSGATFAGNITASEIIASTKLVANAAGGDEGGEILLGKPATNSTIAGTGVTIDVYQNKLRFFEQGGSARGFYINITNGADSAGSNIGEQPLTVIAAKTTAYTFAAGDQGKFIELNGTFTVSIPTDATYNFPIGTQINLLNIGTGVITIAAVTSGTTTVNGTPGLKLRAQWSSATLIKRAANVWVVVGDLIE
jgi:hypothetical protein